MIRSDLKRQTKVFLSTLSNKSDKTVAGYKSGLDVLIMFFDGYYEDDSRALTVWDIEPGDVDHVLSYLIIRKYIAGATFRMDSAKAIKALFRYLAKVDLYDESKAAEIARIADHYRKQYSRLDKLEHSLWNETEGRIDEIMRLPKKKRDAAIGALKAATEDAILKDCGYVSVREIKDGLVYCDAIYGPEENIGPIKFGADSLGLVEVGDVINMISLRQKKGDTVWAVVETGNVYPKPYDYEQ